MKNMSSISKWKRILSGALACAMCLSMGISSFAAEETDGTVYESYSISATVDKKGRMAGLNPQGNALTGVAKELYNAFSDNLKSATNSYITFQISRDSTSEEFQQAFSAYLADQSDVVYWLDKTTPTKLFTETINNQITVHTFFSVMSAYKGTEHNLMLGSTKCFYWDITRNETNDLKEAQGILDGASGKNDEQKIRYFVEQICDLTSYDHNAPNNNDYTTAYQMTSVFDGNPDTKTVCEGYAKAFQYLCNKSGIECRLVEGVINTASGTAGADGAHMWNMVSLGGKWWVVDVTNCDDNAIGAPDKLVLVGTSNETYKTIGFRYDNDSQRLMIATDDHYDSSSVTTYSIAEGNLQNVTLSYNPGRTNLAANSDVTITVTPTAGYENPQLWVDGNLVSLSSNQYVLNVGTSNHTVSASASASGVIPPTPGTYTITEDSLQNVTVSYDPGKTNLAANSNVTITVIPAAGYENPQLWVDGSPVSLTSNQYVLHVGTSNHTVSASASRPNTYSVIIQNGAGVKITADKTTGLRAGETVTVTVAAEAGYESPIGLLDGMEQALVDSKFTFTVSRNHIISGRAIQETFVERIDVTPGSMTIGWSSNSDGITGIDDLIATVTERSGKVFAGNVSWRSSNPTVANVSEKAAYSQDTKTATAAVIPTGYNGTSLITVTAETKTATCMVTVTGGTDYSYDSGNDSSSKSDNDSDYGKGSKKDSVDTYDNSRKPDRQSIITFKPVNEAAVLKNTQSAVAAARKAGNETATVTERNALSVSMATLKSMQNAAVKAGGKSVILQADTMKGLVVESRIRIDASKVTDAMKGDIMLRMSTTSPAVKDHFQKYFSNFLCVIRMDQEGSFGFEVEVATKVDLKGLDTKNLVLYSYDVAANEFAKLDNANYYIDSTGYLHFYTSVGGNIVISDGELAK